jgi:hypothetical protein
MTKGRLFLVGDVSTLEIEFRYFSSDLHTEVGIAHGQLWLALS